MYLLSTIHLSPVACVLVKERTVVSTWNSSQTHRPNQNVFANKITVFKTGSSLKWFFASNNNQKDVKPMFGLG